MARETKAARLARENVDRIEGNINSAKYEMTELRTKIEVLEQEAMHARSLMDEITTRKTGTDSDG